LAKNKLRDKILNSVDVEQEKVYVKQWDVEILIKGMTGKQRDNLLQQCVNPKTGATNMNKLNTLLVIESCFDPETEEKLFEMADFDLIANKSAGALSKVIQVASRLSGLDEMALEEAAKN
jgi:hypothetical protein